MPKPGINLRMGVPLFLATFIVGALVLFGGSQLVADDDASAEAGGPGGPGGAVTPGGPVNVTVVASTLQFKTRTINASPGASVTVTLDNQDAGVLHDLAFYTNRNANQEIARIAPPFPGPATKSTSFAAPSTPGNYYFRCDVHPDTMNGTFQVK